MEDNNHPIRDLLLKDIISKDNNLSYILENFPNHIQELCNKITHIFKNFAII